MAESDSFAWAQPRILTQSKARSNFSRHILKTMRRLRVWGQMAEIIRAEGILSEHEREIGFAPFSADVTTSFRCVKTVDGNVFPLTQMSRIFFVFSCDTVDGNDVVRSVLHLNRDFEKMKSRMMTLASAADHVIRTSVNFARLDATRGVT